MNPTNSITHHHHATIIDSMSSLSCFSLSTSKNRIRKINNENNKDYEIKFNNRTHKEES